MMHYCHHVYKEIIVSLTGPRNRANILKFDSFSVFTGFFRFLKHLDSYFDKPGSLNKQNIRIIHEYCLDV